MTTILAIKQEDTIYISSDTQISSDIKEYTLEKITKYKYRGNLIIVANSGKVSAWQSFRDTIQDLINQNEVNANSFIEVLSRRLRETYKQREGAFRSLLIYKNNLYSLESDGSLSKYGNNNITAIGSGSDFALGVYTTLCEIDPMLSEIEMLNKSIDIASRYDLYTNNITQSLVIKNGKIKQEEVHKS